MNKQRGSATIWISLVIAILIIVGGVYFFQNSWLQKADSALIQINNDDYSLSYSSSLFSQVKTSVTLPGNYKVSNKGVKLIDPKYLSKVGKKECSPSEAPDVSLLCTAENQPGITFAVLNNSINETSSLFKNFEPSGQIISGKRFITISFGVEGSGIAYYLYPLNSNKTLIITRNFEENNTFIPSDAVFNQIISTLVVK